MTAFLVGVFVGFALGLGYPKILKRVKENRFRGKPPRTLGRGGQ